MTKINNIYQGDALSVLKTLPKESVDMVMTSPPYWALRDYGIKEQLGLEPTFKNYIDRLCNIFDEVKRVLKKEGSCWVNMGDTYFGSGKGIGNNGLSKESFTFTEKEKRNCKNCGKEFVGWKFQHFCGSACSGVDNTPRIKKGKLLDKCLCMIPERFAIEMVNRGWILRNQIIWHKRNCMPSSVKDRFTVDFEKIFFFVKNKKYYFNQQFDDANTSENTYRKKLRSHANYNIKYEGYKNNFPIPTSDGKKNKRTIWTINPKPYKEPHFAVYPEELCITPIKAGCPEGGIVLDPFFGSGTTGLVVRKLNRNYIGIELNPDYIKIAEKRLKGWNEQVTL